MAKITLSDLANLDNPQKAVTTINANMASIEEAIENTVSRDGTAPNSMSGDLDMNGFRIINLPVPSDDTEPARHGQLQDYVDAAEAAQEAAETAQEAAEAAQEASESAQTTAETARDEAVLASANVTNYDLIFFSGGAMEDNETLFRLIAARPFTLPASLTGSEFVASGAATGETTVTLKKNGDSIGTLVWAASGTIPTVTFASAVSFDTGDVLGIFGPATADASLSDVSISLVATRA